ncbi:MAG: PrgI family protein [Patescibacteria group bacterium]
MAEKIPQNIEREDKLVGPLTLKQFLYLLGAAGLIFATYQYYLAGYLFAHEFFIISFIVGGLALALAFLKINGLPFISFFGNLIAFMFTRKMRVWGKDNTMERTHLTSKKDSALTPATPSAKPTSRSELEKLATILDTGGKIKTEKGFFDTHIINTIPQTSTSTPEIVEEDLGVEDIFEDTDI